MIVRFVLIDRHDFGLDEYSSVNMLAVMAVLKGRRTLNDLKCKNGTINKSFNLFYELLHLWKSRRNYMFQKMFQNIKC